MIDFQPAMFVGVQSTNLTTIINNVQIVGLTAKIFNCDYMLTTVATSHFSGPMLPELQAIFPYYVPIERTSINAWIDPVFQYIVKNSGCTRIVVCGLWTSMCATFPTLDMLKAGYEVLVVVDACGDQSLEIHDSAIQRMIQAGAIPVTAFSLLCEYQQDWARQETYNDIMYVMNNLTVYKEPARLIRYMQNITDSYTNPVQNTPDTTYVYPDPTAPYPIPPYHAD
jgi:nicotinamidase-related amidase